jgi:hypothetical protein
VEEKVRERSPAVDGDAPDWSGERGDIEGIVSGRVVDCPNVNRGDAGAGTGASVFV